MQACLENPALPLLEFTSLPSHEPTSLPLVDTMPAWTIRVARPAVPSRNELANELLGVPKAALRQVFGKVLGTRLWQQNRAATTPAPATAKAPPVAAISPNAPISDAEISGGMLRYLCAEAATTLCEHKRFANSVALTVQYSNGETEALRQPLRQGTNDATALETAARLALRRMRSDVFVSLKLDVTAATALCASAQAPAQTATDAPRTRVA
jgi:hypothetical protein